MGSTDDSRMLDGLTFNGRFDDIERRMDGLDDPLPSGLTDPDPDTPEERWEAAQVWAHMAEFVGYWHEQLESVVGEYAGDPVPFGRTKRDVARIAAIEVGRQEPVEQLRGRTRELLAALRRYIDGLDVNGMNVRGLHQTIGEMDVERIVERFVVGHLEEHLDQLDGLAAQDT